MFDLVTQIRSWREHLAGDGEYTPSDLDELEVHLREEMTSLARKGLSEQEAFTVACMRVGDSKDLAQEFAKVNTGLVFKRRLFWMGIGLLGMGFASYAAAALSKGAALVAASTGMRGHALGILAESFHILAMVLAIMGVLVLIRRWPDHSASHAWVHSAWGKVGLFVGLATLNLALLASQYLLTAGINMKIGPSGMGEMYLVSAYANLLWPIIVSLLLIGRVLKTGSSIAANPRS